MILSCLYYFNIAELTDRSSRKDYIGFNHSLFSCDTITFSFTMVGLIVAQNQVGPVTAVSCLRVILVIEFSEINGFQSCIYWISGTLRFLLG